MLRRSLIVVGAVVTAVLLSASAVGAAVRPFNAPQTVVGGCASDSGDSVMTANGTLHGYARCQNNQIRYFSRNPDGSVNPSEATGFTGRVLGVTYDNTSSYVLFTTSGTVRIGRRTNAGVYSFRTVDTGVDSTVTTGDVVAKDGAWTGVWDKSVGGQAELFWGGTTVAATRLTTLTNSDDFQPTLALSGSTPVLIWTRVFFASGVSDLYKSKLVGGSWEPPATFATVGNSNFDPDVSTAGGLTFVTWFRDGFIWVASNFTGSFTSRMFNTGGFLPNVDASTAGGQVDFIFVTWTTFTGTVFFAESASTGSVNQTWDGATIAGPDTESIGVGGVATKATVSYLSPAEVTIRSQT